MEVKKTLSNWMFVVDAMISLMVSKDPPASASSFVIHTALYDGCRLRFSPHEKYEVCASINSFETASRVASE